MTFPMRTPCQKDVWDELYRKQYRPWRGTIRNAVPFPFNKGDNVIDIGCGYGKASFALIEAGYTVTGIDFSDVAAEACRRSCGDKMKVICASVTAMPLNDGEADGVTMIHILEHLEKDELTKAVKEVRRVTRPGGKIFVRVFHADDMRSGTGGRIDGSTVVRGNGIRYSYFTEDRLRELFSEFRELSMERIDERTKFGGTRSRIEAIFERTA
jgi:ubiquinone/menaquinone biosynthesis C-methylase UbiE